MEIKKAAEGLENFITTDTIGSTLKDNGKPGDIRLCYGMPPEILNN